MLKENSHLTKEKLYRLYGKKHNLSDNSFEQFNEAVKVLLFDTKIRSKIRLDIDHLKEQNSGVSNRISHKILNLISGNV